MNLAEGIHSLYNIMIYVICAAGVLFAVFMIGDRLGWFKKGANKKDDGSRVAKAKKVSISKFNRVDDFVENFILSEYSTKYTAALVAGGVPLDKMEYAERELIEQNFIGLFNMIDSQIQFYIQSTRSDLSEYLISKKERLASIQERYVKLRRELQTIYKAAEENSRIIEENKTQIDRIKRQIKAIEWQVDHLKEQIEYAINHSGKESAPVFVPHIIMSYVHSSEPKSVDLNSQEILNKARDHLDVRLGGIRNVLLRCGVKSKALQKSDLAQMLYRGYNLSDADVVKFSDYAKTAFSDIAVTTSYFVESQLKERELKIKAQSERERELNHG